MTFFYDLNKRLATLASKQDTEQLAEHAVPAQQPKKGSLAQALNERDLGKHNNATTGFAALAKKTGGGEKGNRIAGAQLAKMRAKGQVEEGHCPACDCAPCKCNEGNTFTGKLKATPKGGKFKLGDKEFKDTSEIEEGFKEMDAWMASREKEKGTGKFDKKERTLPDGTKATTYTRKHEDDEEDDKDAPEAKGGAPKKKGRPKSAASKDSERVTKGSHKYKTVDGKRVKKEKTKEDLDSDSVMMTRPTNCSSESIEHGEQAEYNDEAGMTKDSLHTIMRHAKELESALRDNENLPEWVQEKIGQIKGMMSSVTDYIISTHERDAEQHMEPMAEKSVSKAQRKFMGMAHAIQKGERIKGASPELKKVAKTMKPSDAHDFATTKEKGLPKKVKKTDEANDGNLANNAKPYDKVTQGDVVAGRLGKDEQGGKKKKDEKVDETTVSGSVATATTSGKSSKGGMQFGKGVYEGFNTQVESMITEGMNITVNMNAGEDGETRKSITVSAEGEEADQLATLLKMAGLHGQSAEACGTCGNTPCGCEQTVDEAYGDTDETLNDPDWPTDTETLEAEPNLRTYSGGLNGPKSTGQTTIPVVASQERRLHSESVELERSLFKTWKNYKG